MRDKVFLPAMILMFFLSAVVSGANKYHFEFFSGYNRIAMTDYNEYAQELQDIFSLFDIDANFEKLNSALLVEGSFVMMLESLNAGAWGVYFRGGKLNVFDDKTKIDWSTTYITLLESIESDYSVYYAGLGLRKYLGVFYIGIDSCLYFNGGNYVRDTLYFEEFDYTYEFERKWETSLFGFNFECGIDFWITGNFGIAVRSGYRYAKGTVEVDWGEFFNPRYVDEDVDYSGIYAGAGLMLEFKEAR